jgi:nitrate reductase gamma subunit
MSWLQILTYVAVFGALFAMLAKALRYLRAPEHFRWELYPVPHEKGRADYGGSYLEELDWWKKPPQIDRVRELKEMMAEVILLKGVFHHNRKVWIFSFPFHLGMYICIGWLLLLLGGAILQAAEVSIGPDAGVVGSVIHYLTVGTGYVGLLLSAVGALGLFFWRLSNSGQRVYNSPADYINLLFVALAVIVALIAQLSVDSGFAMLRGYVQSLITFAPFAPGSGLMVFEIALISLLILYIPLSRMSHFVAKYFLYHSIRWNDERNERGSEIERKIIELLQQKVGWSAPHIQTGESWGEVVTEAKDE